MTIKLEGGDNNEGDYILGRNLAVSGIVEFEQPQQRMACGQTDRKYLRQERRH